VSTVREATYEILRDLGMTVIFGNPGSTELPFLRDMPPDFKYVLGLHERVAAGMALGYSLGAHKAVFVNLHSIASTGNGLSAIQDAWYLHAPLVVTAGQQDRRQLRQRFEHQHARHDRRAGKMPLEELFVERDVLNADKASRVALEDRVDERRRISITDAIEENWEVDRGHGRKG